MSDALADLIAAETSRDILAPVRAFAAALAVEADGMTTSVLFYGSNLRTGDLDGVLDFYVLVDDWRAWGLSAFVATANRLLPPHVMYREHPFEGRVLRAKVAVMTMRQFARATRVASRDTTIWARFSQPAVIAWARDEAARRETVMCIATSVSTAAHWAAVLGPAQGRAVDYWRALYAATYAAELRVERGSRSDEIVTHAEERYARLLAPAWRESGIAFATEGDIIRPKLSAMERARGRRSWALRRMFGKPLNVARLVKAAFTFEGGAAYLTWKVERHTRIALALTPWQKRHPILAAPRALWRLWRQGAFR